MESVGPEPTESMASKCVESECAKPAEPAEPVLSVCAEPAGAVEPMESAANPVSAELADEYGYLEDGAAILERWKKIAEPADVFPHGVNPELLMYCDDPDFIKKWYQNGDRD